MKAQTLKLEKIFGQTISYQVPLFQRPYVWTAERNWDPLWEDLQSLLDKYLMHGEVRPHFLGAVVLEQLPQQTGGVESREVIDGQQRFTTLQLMLIAARDQAIAAKSEMYRKRFDSLVTNDPDLVGKGTHEIFKLCPTNSDRIAFELAHKSHSPSDLDLAIASRPELEKSTTNIIDCYKYFYAMFGDWLKGSLDDEDNAKELASKTIEDRFAVAWEVVRRSMQLVVIDLEEDDETQVIFETLNARGEDLLPADLIKNYLFRRATAAGADVTSLYEKHWKQFDDQWWRAELKQGRLNRPRIDIFINYYLSMKTQEDIRSSHLFNAFKGFAEDAKGQKLSAAHHVEEISRYAKVFSQLQGEKANPRVQVFLKRMDAVDTTTVYPFLLYAYGELMPQNRDELEKIIVVLESYLMRRMICGMTTKNYNRNFVELIKAVEKTKSVSAESVKAHLRKAIGDSSLFPTDETVRKTVEEEKFYNRLSQKKVRCVLEALDMYAEHIKSEAVLLPDGLTIEHVMPQQWETNWPIPEDLLRGKDDLISEKSILDAKAYRNRLIHTIGNLTLITNRLNPALANNAWADKRQELLAFSKINLTRYFHSDDTKEWGEKQIKERSKILCENILSIWPGI